MRRYFWGVILVFLFSSLQAKDSPSLVIFGDSLSDTGAGYEICQSKGMPAIPPAPYYYNGRYCDGPNWVDYVAENLQIECKSFAVGGAQSGSGQTFQRFGYDMGGLFDQIDRFEKIYDKIHPQTTIVMAIGSNDFLSLLFTPDQLSQEGVTDRARQTMVNIVAACNRLQNLGGYNNYSLEYPRLWKEPQV